MDPPAATPERLAGVEKLPRERALARGARVVFVTESHVRPGPDDPVDVHLLRPPGQRGDRGAHV